MAIVYLPYGYPILQGLEYDSVIYQGTVARKYTVSSDPRRDSQVFERKLLSDVSKMRSSAEKMAKGLWKLAFGSRWSTIIYQMMRGDIDGLWSARDAEWESFDNDTKFYLAAEAPFKVTFNDPGKIWWCLYGMLYDWADQNSLGWWGMPGPDENAIDDMYDWWKAGEQLAEIWGVLVADGDYEQNLLTFDGDWSTENHASASGGSYAITDENGASVSFVFWGRHVRILYTGLANGWYLNLAAEQDEGTWQIYQREGSTQYQLEYDIHFSSYRMHRVVCTFANGGNPSNEGTIDAIKVRRLKSSF